MAEALGFAASLIAVIQLADRVSSICKLCIESVDGYPKELRVILIEISTLKAIFKNLKFVDESDPDGRLFLKTLGDPEGPVTGCLHALNDLEKLLPSEHLQWNSNESGHKTKRHKVKITLASLAWPFKKDKALVLLNEIIQHKTTISVAFSVEAWGDLKEVRRDLSIVCETLTDSEKNAFCSWLQHTDPSSNHNRAYKLYEKGTGSWVLCSLEWIDWIGLRKRCLWIHGIPGAGKTVLASYLIEEMKQVCNKRSNQRVALVYFYCYHAHNQDEAVPFLRWVVSQLCRKAGKIHRNLYNMYDGRHEPTSAELLTSLEAVLAYFDTVFIAIDAIDESQPWGDLLKILDDLTTDVRFGKIQLLATSREYPDIERTMTKISQPLSMANPLAEADIKLYISGKIRSTFKFQQWPPSLQLEVEEVLSTGAKGMFRWAVCQLDILRRLSTVSCIRMALRDLPGTLDETYYRIFSYVSKEDWPFLRHVLHMICSHDKLHEDMRLSSKLIVSAFPFMAEHGPESVFTFDHFYNSDLLKEICGCLVTFSQDDELFEETAILAHYTVREFLESDRISTGPAGYFFLQQERAEKNFIVSAFQQAHTIESYEETGSSDEEWEDNNRMALFNSQVNIDNYFLFSAIRALYFRPALITDDEKLTTLAYDFVNPTLPNFRQRVEAIKAIIFDTDELHGMFEGSWDERRFWDLKWILIPSEPRIAVLAHLLWLGRPARKLAEKLLTLIDHHDLTRTQLSFLVRDFGSFTELRTDFEFNGNIIEVFAEANMCLGPGAEAMKFLCKWAIDFDPTTTLVSFISSHYHIPGSGCEPRCVVDWLLDHGADPNPKGYRVTPLQIAVASWDYHGVESLLAAGADPNNIGDADGLKWGDNTVKGRFFDQFCGHSPLYIFRHPEISGLEWGVGFLKFKEYERPGIEHLLLSFNAIEI